MTPEPTEPRPAPPHDRPDALTPPHPRPTARVGLLHVLVTPAPDLRTLLTTLTALSAARDPRLVVTAVLPEGGEAAARRLADPAAWPGRPPRLLPADRACDPFGPDPFAPDASAADPFAPGSSDTGPLVAGPDPAAFPTPAPGEPLFLLQAGAIPPRGWTETLLAHGRSGAGPGLQPGGPVRAVAASAWTSDRADESHAERLEHWARADRAARRSWYRLAEDRLRVQTPLVALLDAGDLRAPLAAWWRGGCRGPLPLGDDLRPDLRLLVAKDLLVFAPEQGGTTATVAAEPDHETAAELETLSDPADVRRRAELLEARLASGTDPRASLRLADLCLRRGRRDETVHHARACLAAWPACAEAQLLLARALGGSGQLDGARALLDRIFEAGPLEPALRAGTFAALASIWLQRGDAVQARPCLDTALAVDPDLPQARYTRARLFLAEGNFDLALADLESALRRRPLVPDMWFELGRARLLAGHEAAGRRALERALELDPRHEAAAGLVERLEPHPRT